MSSTDRGRTDSRSGLAVLTRVPIRGVRKAVAEALARTRWEIPEATTRVDVDATALPELLRDSLATPSARRSCS